MSKVSPEDIKKVLESLTYDSVPPETREVLDTVWEYYLTAPGSAEVQFKSIMSVMYILGRRQGRSEAETETNK